MGIFRKSKKQPSWRSVALGITGGGQQDEPATVLTAEKLSESITSVPLSREKKKIAEPAVHYACGALVGALYGGIAAKAPLVAHLIYGLTGRRTASRFETDILRGTK
ncbi:MAG TPA: hypothetical protein VGL82_16305 [Bryobacteraceae bacterium]